MIFINIYFFNDPLHVPIGPITKARSKKIKEALNGLIQEIWVDSNAGHSKLGPKEDEGFFLVCSNFIPSVCDSIVIIGSSAPKEPLMLEGKEGDALMIDDYHEDEFEDEEDQASLNHEGRFAPRKKGVVEVFKSSKMARWD
ncbi:hypothetical protein AAG906_003648 [Vitis piasezkii]